ncbi:hypothetical protein DPEC_G00083210 [Dallia pectoralis]|uniref:Uncharacterized protein n=1 Tax=Dallia pectoralis TaxID=75939 RepID=A0ACC2GZ60_DALPE|nr:hypothetical protein DPEC_G00083210 [Dallia pectoralis]
MFRIDAAFPERHDVMQERAANVNSFAVTTTADMSRISNVCHRNKTFQRRVTGLTVNKCTKTSKSFPQNLSANPPQILHK